MASPLAAYLMESVAKKRDALEEYSRFEVDTEPPTDDDSDDEEFSFSHQSTDRTEASVEAQCGDLDEVDIDTNFQENLVAGSPLFLAVDMDDSVQVMQGTKLVMPSALLPSADGADSSFLVAKRVFPKRPPGVFFRTSESGVVVSHADLAAGLPKRPPGFFFRPPPGLPPPSTSVQGQPSLSSPYLYATTHPLDSVGLATQ
eukprot:TRINITY_DN663_c0_g3_i1.p1 TRINITY_DN663_c0_g3~~TRINITY_DN663_c0_g3_i1.p1  ORF type:complete len:223 (-),score=26.99 TRINITY_DN663_c0_g3_i1:473-1075(-)